MKLNSAPKLMNYSLFTIKSLILSFSLVFCLAVYSNQLRVGISNFNPPFSIPLSETLFSGFDIDIMSAICHSLAVKCHYIPILREDLSKSINEGKVDVVIASVIIPPLRQQNFLFSDVYLKSYARIITHAWTRDDNTDFSSLFNKKIGVISGTTYASLAEELFKHEIQLIKYAEIYDLLLGVQTKEVNAALIDSKVADYWFSLLNTDGSIKNDLSFIDKEIPIGQGYGIMMHKKNTVLQEKINQALSLIKNNGTYQKIYNNYFDN